MLVCVDGQSSTCKSTATRWLTGTAMAECRKYAPDAIVCLLATKADSVSERKAEATAEEFQAFVDQGLCSTWAQVSARALTGIYDKNDFLKQLLHALVSRDMKTHKSRSRRSFIKPRQSITGGNAGTPSARLSISEKASILGTQLKDVALRCSSIIGTN
ncbi:hypothetical protein cyc_06784 [Cyclospora cayetanensis]|uniref:Uncharacterized protein n=1 Tax=Cyclospora cayetanensis TaxID=88456 RepID=A0A1D3D2U8_9EIME|nr:hypothetical protein cyc_06784 [Cyclospora cayetanensis]